MQTGLGGENELVERAAILGLPEEPLIIEGISASSPSLSSGISSSQHSTDIEISSPSSVERPELFEVENIVNGGTVPAANAIQTDIEDLDRAPDGVVKGEKREEVLLSLEPTK